MGNTDTLKTCSKCGLSKPIVSFHKDRGAPTGVYYWCKLCTSKKHKKIYTRVKDTEQYRLRQRIAKKLYMSRHPERALAHSIAGRNKTKLIKTSCERCNSTDKLHMHHPDYSKPLEVITLCIPCHETEHHGEIV